MVRIRTGNRTKTAAVAAVTRNINFGHFWRQLRAAGWSYKRPTGIQTKGKYVSADGSIVLVGEEAVVAYALKTGLLDAQEDVNEESGADAEAVAVTKTVANVETPAADAATPVAAAAAKKTAAAAKKTAATAAAAKKTATTAAATAAVNKTAAAGDFAEAMSDDIDSVRASQIDTSTQLSQRTMDELFGTPSSYDSSDPELSQSAVARAFGFSNLQLLSEVSGAESDAQADTSLDGQQDGVSALQPTRVPATPPTRIARPRRSVKKDVNFIPDDEDLSEYESFSSGESDDDIEDDNDDDDIYDCGEPEESDDLSEDDAAPMDAAFIESLQVGSDALNTQATQQREAALRAMEWTPVSHQFEQDVQAYPGLIMEEAQPVAELCDVCHSPLLTFFYFMPKALWVKIAAEMNRYSLQQLNRRAEQTHAKQKERRRETVKQIIRRLKAKPGYETHEILHVIGLLIARMLCPQKRRFAAHWSMVEDGAVPAGNFGRFMGRNRCQDILRDLHFVDNEAERTRDKLWKLRMIVDSMQHRFLIAWTLPGVFSFDEGVLPSTSKRNTTRMFMPDKPHRYGTKMFMVCDSRTAYCHRFELYTGKRRAGDDESSSFDHKTGAAAVVRNLKTVLAPNKRHPWHAVVVDRFYSSILLAIELLAMQVYVIGTIMTNRLGYDTNVKEKRKSRPGSVPRGAFTFSRSVAIPSMVAFHWWDRKPVHYLCTGSAMTETTIARNIKRVGAISVSCPAAVTDYQRWMGGVDVHDQLRLQTYSLQTSTKFKKYYKSLFLGFVDLALVNAYISHKEAARIAGKPAMKRGEWYGVLQNQLLQLKVEDFAGVVATPTPSSQKRKRSQLRLTHAVEQADDWVTVTGVQKRRQRSCKVCALLRTDRKKKSFATTFFCERCSIDDAKCWLCNKIRRQYKGVAKTCFEIWHDDFDCGQNIPATLGKRVVLRRPGKKAGAHKKTRRELMLREGEDGDDENESGEE